ncbi:MAG: hypothetical protein AAF125_17335 [Chloroflexota bacterium]
MSHHDKNNYVAGSKTGVIKRDMSQFDGKDQNVNKTGVLRRPNLPPLPDNETEQRREPPAPPTLPEVNNDDGGTTGLIDLNMEGQDSARREDHPNQ